METRMMIDQPSNTISRDTTTRRNMEKSVSFRTTVEIKCTIHINDFSQEERSSYWLTHADKVKIRKEVKEIVHHITESKYACSNKRREKSKRRQDEFRGADTYSFEKVKLRQIYRMRASGVVFDIQELQRRQGYNNIEEIASAYKAQTSPSQSYAYKVGLSDHLVCCDDDDDDEGSNNKFPYLSLIGSPKAKRSRTRHHQYMTTASSKSRLRLNVFHKMMLSTELRTLSSDNPKRITLHHDVDQTSRGIRL